jgi:hypothetical protein
MEATLYDHEGRVVAYIDSDGESIYLYDGEPVAWKEGDGIYSYRGTFLGWVVAGWVLDVNGDHVFFTDSARGGPVKPVRNVGPIRGMRGVRPVRGVRAVRPVRPVRSLRWSVLSGEEFFFD